MAADTVQIEEMGPIDYFMVEFPQLQVTGEGMRELIRLVDNGLIRVLDLTFVRRSLTGAIDLVPLSAFDADDSFDLTVFAGASSGLLNDEDLREAGELLEPGNTAAILVYENLWAAPLAATLRRKGAQLVAGGRIPLPELLAALDASEAAPASPSTSHARLHEARS